LTNSFQERDAQLSIAPRASILKCGQEGWCFVIHGGGFSNDRKHVIFKPGKILSL
jgi:hypothetical protein